ncbi:hypothetical protein DFH06DRAFT_1124003 [Mycena polygramma]|nr:hypothetical protein DFH06DRAFT_1124003 [Mycena polygramma]
MILHPPRSSMGETQEERERGEEEEERRNGKRGKGEGGGEREYAEVLLPGKMERRGGKRSRKSGGGGGGELGRNGEGWGMRKDLERALAIVSSIEGAGGRVVIWT